MKSSPKKVHEHAPLWMFYGLLAAAVYNLVWGGVVIAFPHLFFDLSGMERLNYPQIWQCVGMIVGVYGVGYAIAAFDPLRFWPIVLVGFLGKVFGPIGFVQALWSGAFSLSFGWNIVFNDLIWWIPFFLILKWCFVELQKPDFETEPLSESEALQKFKIEGQSLAEISFQSPLLLVFLRHFGCTFCRETVSEIAQLKKGSQWRGAKLAFVHMSSEARAREFLEAYGLGGEMSLSDPQQVVYRSFELGRASWRQVFEPRVLWRGFLQAVLRRHGVGRLEGDGFQLPGAVFVEAGKVKWRRIPKSLNETVDWRFL